MRGADPSILAQPPNDGVTVAGDTSRGALVLQGRYIRSSNKLAVSVDVVLSRLFRLPRAILVATADHPGILSGNGIAVANDGFWQVRIGGFDPI